MLFKQEGTTLEIVCCGTCPCGLRVTLQLPAGFKDLDALPADLVLATIHAATEVAGWLYLSIGVPTKTTLLQETDAAVFCSARCLTEWLAKGPEAPADSEVHQHSAAALREVMAEVRQARGWQS